MAAFHGLGQLATVMAMGLGSVSFVNVVKALEPVCTALIALLVTGVGLPWQVDLTRTIRSRVPGTRNTQPKKRDRASSRLYQGGEWRC